MPRFQSTSGPIYYEQHGARSATPILLIHGLGCQVIQWPESFIKGLVDADYRVITMDNRDTGLTFGVDAPPPTVVKLIAAQTVPSMVKQAYTLEDMAEDTVQLLDHIGQSGAHIIGVSMGGMIAQYLGINHPARVFSLTLLMSTTGNKKIPDPAPNAVASLAGTFKPRNREETIAASQETNMIFGGPHYDSCKYGIGRFTEQAYDRANRPDGVLRQLGAILTAPDRRKQLQKLDIPSLMIHGDHDPLMDQFGSKDLAENIPNSKLVILENLGHDLPEPVIPRFLKEILEHIGSVTTTR